MDSNNFNCVSKLEHALHVWDESNPPYSYQKIGWGDDRFYLRGEDALYLPGPFYAGARGLSYLLYGQTTENVAKQMTSMASTSIKEFKNLEENLSSKSIIEADIPRLIKMLHQLKKTTECFSRGINTIAQGKNQATGLEHACDYLTSSVHVEIERLSELILKNYISIDVESNGGKLQLPYLICVGLHKYNGSFFSQLQQIEQFQLKCSKKHEESLAVKWLLGRLSADLTEFPELEKSTPDFILRVEDFYEFYNFVNNTPFNILKEQCKEFAKQNNIVLMLTDPEKFKSYMIKSSGASELVDFETLSQRVTDSIDLYFKQKLKELEDGKILNSCYDHLTAEIFKLIQILEDFACDSPANTATLLHEIIAKKDLAVSLSLGNEVIKIPFSTFLNLNSNLNDLKNILFNIPIKLGCSSISNFILGINWLQDPEQLNVNAENLQSLSNFATQLLKENRVNEKSWFKFTKLAFTNNLSELKINLKHAISEVTFNLKEEIVEFFKVKENSSQTEEKELFVYLIRHNQTIKKIKDYINSNRNEIISGKIGKRASNNAVIKLKVASIPSTLSTEEIAKELKTYDFVAAPGKSTNESGVKEYKLASIAFTYNKSNKSIKILEFPNTIFYDTTNEDITVRAGFLGKGGFKVVRKFLSVNRLNFLAIGKQTYESHNFKTSAYSSNEVMLMKLLKGKPHVIQIHSASRYSSVRKNMKYVTSIITEFCNMGELVKHVTTLTLKQKDQIACGIIKGLLQIHGENIIHRDLKLENIFLKLIINDKGEEEIYPVIADFGLSCKADNIPFTKDYVGTQLYMPPELLFDKRPATKENDLWSLGILFSGLFKNQFPFNLTNTDTFHFSVLALEAKPRPNQNSIDFLIWSLLRGKPEDRLDLKSALAFMEKRLESEIV